MNPLPDLNTFWPGLDTASQGCLQRLAALTPGVLCVFDVERRQFIGVSQACEQVTGYPAHQVLAFGEAIARLVHPDDLPTFIALQDGLRALPDDETRELDWRLVQPEGGYRRLHSRLSVFTRNPAGQVQQVLATTDTVVDTQQVDERLAYQTMLLENVSDAIVATDERLVVTAWNRAAEQLYGWTAEEAIGRKLPEVLRTEVSDAERQAALEVALETGEYRSEVRQRTKEGALLTVESYARTLRDAQGNFIGLVGVNRDVTERRQAQAVLRRSHAELEALVADRTSELAGQTEHLKAEVSQRQRLEQTRLQLLQRMTKVQEQERRRLARELHDELGGQMTALKMAVLQVSHELAAGADTDALAQALTAIANDLDQAVDTVRSLATELRPPLLDLLGLVPALQSHFQTYLARTGLRGEAFWPTEYLPLTDDAATGLFRIFQEALTNITRHAHAARVTVRLERQAAHLVMRVEDDGRGLPAQTSSGHWGLAGMRERAELAGGQLEVESDGQHGTAIVVKLPLTG